MAPFTGVLMGVDDAARLTAELIEARATVLLHKTSLDQCQSDLLSHTDETVRVLEPIPTVVTRQVEVQVETIPWWVWPVMGVVAGAAFGIGLAF